MAMEKEVRNCSQDLEQGTWGNQDHHLYASPTCSNATSEIQHRPLCWSLLLGNMFLKLGPHNASSKPTRRNLDLPRHQNTGAVLPTDPCPCVSSFLIPLSE